MGLKVIGAGLGRTGTLSLKLALTEIGFGPCYHMMEVFAAPERVMQWHGIFVERETPDWQAVFAGYQATVDWPACNYYRELMEAFPDAKVILSTRPAEEWFASTQATIMSDEMGAAVPPFIPPMFEAIIGPDKHDKAAVIAGYERHNAAVRAHVSKDKLLEYVPGQGWGPLCAFLGVPAPTTPFPKVNTTEDFRARFPAP